MKRWICAIRSRLALLVCCASLLSAAGVGAQPDPTHPALAVLGHPDSIPIAVTGSGFGDGSTAILEVSSAGVSVSIPGDADCGGVAVHTCIEHWEDELIVAKLSPTSTAARVRVVTGACPGDCSDFIRAQYYMYDYAKTLLPGGIAGIPLALALDPADPLRRVWLNEEAHRKLKALTPGDDLTEDLPILHPFPFPFFTQFLDQNGQPAPGQSILSMSGEDVVVDPYHRIWFSEGGWPLGVPQTHWNYSRVVMYEYDPEEPTSIEKRVYNLPGNDSQVLALAYDPGRDRVWYSVRERKVGGFSIIPARIGWFDPDDVEIAHDGSRPFTTTTQCVLFSCTNPPFANCCADNQTRRCPNNDFDCAGSNEVCYSDEPPNQDCKFHEFRLPAATNSAAHLAIDDDGILWYADYWGTSGLGRLDPDEPDGDIRVYPLGDDTTRGPNPPNWLLGSAPWEIQIAPNGDVLINEYTDMMVNRFDVTRVDDPACLTLVGFQNPCMESLEVPGPVEGYRQHTIFLDGRENVWLTTQPDGALNYDPNQVATIGYVKRDWSEVALFPTPTLFPLEPGEPTAGSGCANPNGDPFRGFHGTGITVDPLTEDVWFGDFCRQRISRLSPTATNVGLGKPASQASSLFGSAADRAVDGNVDGAFANGSVAQTIATLPLDPWWQTDLGSVQWIDEIEVWNRTDPNAIGWLQNYYVLVSDVPFVSGNLSAVLAQPGVTAIHHPNPAGTMSVSTLRRNGRYVRVQLVGNKSLALAEVVVLGKNMPNLAHGKTATQASTIFGNVASRAVDGNVNGLVNSLSVSQTVSTLPSDPWWQVDLGSVQEIEEIELWNRTDPTVIGWMQNYYVLVSNVPFVSTSLAAVLAQPGVTAIHHPEPAGTMSVSNVGRSGRYVRVQRPGSNGLGLAEVVVSGVPN